MLLFFLCDLCSIIFAAWNDLAQVELTEVARGVHCARLKYTTQIVLPDAPKYILWRTKRKTDDIMIGYLESMGWKRLAGRVVQDANLAIVGKVLPPINIAIASSTLLINGVYGMQYIGGSKEVEYNTRAEYAQRHGCEFNKMGIQPETYNLGDADSCRHFFKQISLNTKSEWFLKRGASGKGKGVEIMRSKKDMEKLRRRFGECTSQGGQGSGYIVQRSIEEPLYIYDRRFDIRCYIVIVSTYPLIVLYHDGYLRRSMVSKDDASEDEKGFYLTNTHVARTRRNFQDGKEHIWTLRMLDDYMHQQDESRPRRWSEAYFRNRAISIARFAVNAARSRLKQVNGTYAFFGMDFMVDSKLKAHLIEINTTPGMTATRLTKFFSELVKGALDIVFEIQVSPRTSLEVV